MSHKKYRISIRKEALKFSSAHMTVFSDGTKEALHGHNYSTEISIETSDVSLDEMISFSYFKEIIKSLCDQWDEKVLVARNCPFLEIKSESTSETSGEIEFLLCKKRYVLPRDEVVYLPIDNVTAENLSEEFCNEFLKKIHPQILRKVSRIGVKIEESPGQGATFFWKKEKHSLK